MPRLTVAARQVLDQLRADIAEGTVQSVPSHHTLANRVAKQLNENQKPNLRRVINGTGTILHTNLGRAPLPQAALDAINDTARGYSTLEYRVREGTRGSRHSHVEELLTALTGAEAAMVVNNNAAAVLLALSALTNRREVIVSRGELVEIGGSFRVPDVLLQSNCHLVEVGTTNKTHAADYVNAIDPERTGALLRVHTSNFKIVGFTSAPTLEELASIAKQHNIPLIEDLGSGCMMNLSPYGIHGQPVVRDSVKAGVDVITFSGDKLLGGPQAGILVGRADLIAKMKAHPLARAMRMDKLSLAALEATLRLYQDPKSAIQTIPTLHMLCITGEALEQKAKRLQSQLGDTASGKVTIVTEQSQVGGGALPGETIPSAVLALILPTLSADALERHFRLADIPIIGRIAQDQFLLDVRTIEEADFPLIAARFQEVAAG